MTADGIRTFGKTALPVAGMSGKRYGKFSQFEVPQQRNDLVAENHYLFQRSDIAEPPVTGPHGRAEIVFHGSLRFGRTFAGKIFYIAAAAELHQFGIQGQTGKVKRVFFSVCLKSVTPHCIFGYILFFDCFGSRFFTFAGSWNSEFYRGFAAIAIGQLYLFIVCIKELESGEFGNTFCCIDAANHIEYCTICRRRKDKFICCPLIITAALTHY